MIMRMGDKISKMLAVVIVVYGVLEMVFQGIPFVLSTMMYTGR